MLRLFKAGRQVNNIRCKSRITLNTNRIHTKNYATNSYADEMYRSWLRDPKSVDASWNKFFSSGSKPQTTSGSVGVERNLKLGVRVQQLIRAYQVMGHNKANIDPLGLLKRPDLKELYPESYGITEADLDIEVPLLDTSDNIDDVSGPQLSVRQILAKLKDSYCGTIGVEYMHIQDRTRCNWLRERLENRNKYYNLSPEGKKLLYERLAMATKFEQYLAVKFTDKRFGCDGGEVVIPALNSLVDTASDMGVEDIVFGMAHRGRLNVLANVLCKPYSSIFQEFQAGTLTNEYASGDVKYHLGTSYDRPTQNGKIVHLSLVANPSHLEAVNPVVEGKVAAKKYYKGDSEGKSVMSVLIHGDASFVGQGIVYETIQMSGIKKYSTGGTVHVIINNQIGFTTDPIDSRPGQYCTDVMNTAGAPILHVNGDDPDAVIWAVNLAVDWRQTFHEDVVLDIVCYRRYGHNEVDQPRFTQPLLYQKISTHPPTLDIYANQLNKEGVLSTSDLSKISNDINNQLENHFADAKLKAEQVLSGGGKSSFNKVTWTREVLNQSFHSDHLANMFKLVKLKDTGISSGLFDQVAANLAKVPEGFTLHPNIAKMMSQKHQTLTTGQDIDWATAEAMAFGSLLAEGFHVRLSGQDVERGTFSQRHAVLHDQKTGAEYIPLNNIPGQIKKLSIKNSFLSEYAALGYELGYSLEDPNSLIMWEAQFGDFVNGAQIIIDQFISCGEQKWMRQSGLVMLLPHGYEGQGPEHSSARLERFLQLSDQDLGGLPPSLNCMEQLERSNWIIANCTTPANYFHVLRRQLHSEFRKPLVIVTPKSLLRHPLCKSNRSEFEESGDSVGFNRVYGEVKKLDPSSVKRVVFCTGKVYYDLFEERDRLKVNDVAIVRIEQLAPFPFDLVSKQLDLYPNAEYTWVQEEPKNMGAWTFCYFSFKALLESRNNEQSLSYVGRPASASPATGSSISHKKEQARILEKALNI
eukprot:TRINITY_DN125_c0_g1_i1.p1 TRINITY_DN125_c0_g1~~TRINITY_DN125_c0_g1_i1.p1  ORF type:complete len:976 (-),score=270.64 TRINITY_DN125_c0_g1_i1:145-3072(-)